MKMSKGRWWQQFQNLNFNLTKYNIWHECCNNKFPKGLSKHTTVQHIRSYTILWMFMYIHICTVYNWKIVINFDNIQWNKFWQKIGKIVFEKKKVTKCEDLPAKTTTAVHICESWDPRRDIFQSFYVFVGEKENLFAETEEALHFMMYHVFVLFFGRCWPNASYRRSLQNTAYFWVKVIS